MKRKFLLYLLAILLQQQLVFAQTHPLIEYLPSNTSMVMSFNPIAIGKKIPAETFRQSSIYRDMTKEDDTKIKAFLSDPAVSGIDFSHDLLLITINDTSSGLKGNSTHILGLIKNEALFAMTMQKMNKHRDSMITYGTDKILFKNDGTADLAWNKNVFVINLDASKQLNSSYHIYNDSLSQEENEKEIQRQRVRLQNLQRDVCFDLLTKKPTNGFSQHTHLTSLMNATGDIKSWNNGSTNPILGNKLAGLAGLGKLQAFTGNNKTSIINFENGKIVVQSNNYPTEAVAAVYKKYPTAPMNTELSRRLPKGKLLALFNTSYNPAMGKELMQQSGLKELMGEMKSPFPVDFNLITAAFGNNMMLAVVQSENTAAEDSITKEMGGIKLILAMPIANKARFDELRIAVAGTLDSLKNKESGSKMMKGMNPSMKYTDNLFVVSLSPDVATAFLNNNNTESVPAWLQSAAQYPMVMNLNMKEILQKIVGKKMKGGDAVDAQRIMNMFGNLVMYGGNFEKDHLTTMMEFQFSNTTDNSLKQLFEMISIAAEKK